MRDRGFFLSLESALSLILIAVLCVALISSAERKSGAEELYIFQKENDVLRVWSAKGFDNSALIEGFEKMFPEQNGKIEINGIIFFEKGKIGKNEGAISSEAEFFDSLMNKTIVKITVFT